MEFEGCPWVNWEPPALTFCEDALCSWIKTPANAWSSASFCIVGLFIFYSERQSKSRELSGYGLMAICIGLLSFFYHSSLTRLGEIGDLSSMFLIGVFLCRENMLRMNWLNHHQGRIFFWLANIICTGSLFVFKELGAPLFFAQCMFALGLEVYLFKNNRGAKTYFYFKASLACWLSSQLIWFLDLSRIVCVPNFHWIQGHAVWHIGMSGLTWFIYRHYTQIDFDR